MVFNADAAASAESSAARPFAGFLAATELLDKPSEEIVGDLRGRAVDQPRSDLCELAADLRLGLVVDARAAARRRQARPAPSPLANPAAPPWPSNLIVYDFGATISESTMRPLNLADTGPTRAVIATWYSLSDTLSIDSQPAMHAFSTSGSLSAPQVVSTLAGTSRLPLISMVPPSVQGCSTIITPREAATPCDRAQTSVVQIRPPTASGFRDYAPAGTHRHTAAWRECLRAGPRNLRNAASGLSQISRRQDLCRRSISRERPSPTSLSRPSLMSSTIAPCPSRRRDQRRLNSARQAPMRVPPAQSVTDALTRAMATSTSRWRR